MKVLAESGTVENPVIIINPELDKYDNVELFPEKMEKARQIIARAGLPPVKRQKQK